CYVLGHRAEYVTFAWMVWELTHEPIFLGYLGLAQGVPLIVFQLWGGVLADRVNRLRLLIGTQVLTALALGVAFALTLSGDVTVTPLLVLAALTSVFRAFDEPSRLSMIPQLIDRARLSNAIALGSIPWQAGRMIGPSITGILIAAYGGTVGFGLAVADDGRGDGAAGTGGLQQHVLSHTGQHVPSAARARSPARARAQHLLALLEPAAAGRVDRRRAGGVGQRALRSGGRRRHGRRQRAPAADLAPATRAERAVAASSRPRPPARADRRPRSGIADGGRRPW